VLVYSHAYVYACLCTPHVCAVFMVTMCMHAHACTKSISGMFETGSYVHPCTCSTYEFHATQLTYVSSTHHCARASYVCPQPTHIKIVCFPCLIQLHVPVKFQLCLLPHRVLDPQRKRIAIPSYSIFKLLAFTKPENAHMSAVIILCMVNAFEHACDNFFFYSLSFGVKDMDRHTKESSLYMTASEPSVAYSCFIPIKTKRFVD
jgi:hypothetical protein